MRRARGLRGGEGRDEGADALRLAAPREPAEPRERLRDSREAGAGVEARSPVADHGRFSPDRLVALEVATRDEPAAVVHERQQLLRQRAPVGGGRPLVRQQPECADEPGLLQPVARPEQPPAGGVDPRALVHCHHRLEHREARRVRRGELDPRARERQRGLAEAAPRQPPEALPERPEARRHPRNRTGRRPDRVVDELRAERNLQMDELRLPALPAEAGNRAEAVEVRGRGRARVPVDRVPTAEQPRHHRLGHAGGEAGGDRGVGGGAAVREDLEAGVGRRGMPRGDGGGGHRVGAFPVTGRTRIVTALATLARPQPRPCAASGRTAGTAARRERSDRFSRRKRSRRSSGSTAGRSTTRARRRCRSRC